jgi:response regulator RpfG family c-di-GMP phosphodiesterase
MSPVSKVTGPSEPIRPTVLFVDDHDQQLAIYERLFAGDPLRIITVPSGLHALQILRAEKVHLIVSDYSMLGMSGVTLLREVGRLYPDTGRILLTGGADSELVLDSPCRVLTKGMDMGLIRRAIVREAFRHV